MTNKTIPELPGVGSLTSDTLFEISQGGISYHVTYAQVRGSVPPTSASYLLVSAASGLTQARSLGVSGTPLSITDGGPGSSYVIEFDDTADLENNARVEVKENGSSVALRRAINFVAGANVAIDVQDDPATETVDVEISTVPQADPTLTYLTLTDETGSLPNSARLLPGNNVTFDSPTPNELTISVPDAPSPTLSYVTHTDQTGALPDSRQLVAGPNITLDYSTPGVLEIIGSGSGGGGAPTTATYLTEDDETGDLPNSRRLLAGTNISFDDSTPGERTINASGGGGGGGNVDIQVFTSNGTWNKPANALLCTIMVIGAGGGGGSGRRGAAGTARSGGGGGPGGGTVIATVAASALGDSEPVVVGAGGLGGAAVTTDDTDGNPGQPGAPSQFGSYLPALGAPVGGSGGATTNLSPSNPAGTGYTANGQPGGGTNVTTTGNGAPGGQGNNIGATGGGGGGGLTAENVVGVGGTGGGWFQSGGTPLLFPGGTSGAGVAGGDGTDVDPGLLHGGTGGGGGSPTALGVGNPGGHGGNYGAGGGGGSASLNGNDSGAGGNGASGVVIVMTLTG